MPIDEEKIKKEGIKLLEEFSKKLEKVPELGETHYVLDLKNIMRKDKKAITKKKFREKFKRIAPKFEEGYLIAEKGV